ncbi:HD domain-containing protein [Streptomyces sp. NPDC053427]|uniref:HD domain-containing protein n=1 Tax=Streptomyces sp. NPDC053427 TaxID=3365701 RepID=UPI0037D06A5F
MKTLRQFGLDRKLAPHGLAGQVLLGEWLEERRGWTGRQAVQFTVVVGGHHGVPPDHHQLKDLYDHPELLRTPGVSEPVWRGAQDALLEGCADAFGALCGVRACGSSSIPLSSAAPSPWAARKGKVGAHLSLHLGMGLGVALIVAGVLIIELGAAH